MLAKIAFGDIGKLFDEHGQPKRLFELSDDIGPAVKTLKAGEARDSTGAVRRRWFSISVHDKFRALAFLLERLSSAGPTVEDAGTLELEGVLPVQQFAADAASHCPGDPNFNSAFGR